VAKETGLDKLQAILQQLEAEFGPLIGLGHGRMPADDSTETDEVGTVLEFDVAQGSPGKLAFLRQCIGDAPPQVANATVIGTGQCFVTGGLLMLAAFRPNDI
jgi:hypothetical protein